MEQNDNYQIKFRRKKLRSTLRVATKIILIILVSLFLVGIIFSNITMKNKYDKVINDMKQSEKNNNSIILDYTQIIKNVAPSLVSISNSSNKLVGNTFYNENLTGIVISEDGMILTNYSDFMKYDDIYVKISGKGTLPIKAEFVDGNKEIDVAIIRIKYDGILKPIKFAENEFSTGDSIAILSNSIGDEVIGSIIPGIITSINKKHIDSKGVRKYNLLEVSANVNFENTGGAVCNSKGELIGIASNYITTANNDEGLFYALDLSELQKIISLTTEFKEILGLIDGSVLVDANSNTNGFYVGSVKKGGNAYNAGIKATDIIFQIEGVNIVTVEDITKVLKSKKNGDNISCKVIRNGEIRDVNIVLSEY